MSILGREQLPGHGPYIGILYSKEPLRVPEGRWPDRNSYQESIIFEFADDLLHALCTLSDLYSPFDPWEVTNITLAKQLQEFQARMEEWIDAVNNASADRLTDRCSWLYTTSPDASPDARVSPDMIRADLIETLEFLVAKVKLAIQNHDTITIVGI